MKLFVVRHGQSEANLSRIYAGQFDSKLTDQGRMDAQRIRPVLETIPFDRVYSSDLTRAIDTQRIALPGFEGIRTPLLREFDVGSLVGLTSQQAIARYGNEFRMKRDYTTFGGEDNQMVCQRAQDFLQLLEADPCEHVAAFSHNGFMNSLLQVVLKSDFDRAAVVGKNCNIAVYEYTGTQWRLLAWNYMGKL